MTGRMLATSLAFAILLSGCAARWQSEKGPVSLTEACPQRRALRVEVFGDAGLHAVYNFVTQGASDTDLAAFLRRGRKKGFDLMLMTVNINGLDTTFATGPLVLRSQEQVDAEFEAACRLGVGPIYLTHVQYNPADENGPSVRVR